MTKSQINVFNKLLEDETFRGKKQLRHLLWLNTSKPKFKIGDCFKVSDPGHRVYGYPVVNFNAKIINVSSFINEEDWRYEMEMSITCGYAHMTSKVYKYESELVRAQKVKDNSNILGQAISTCSESLDV